MLLKYEDLEKAREIKAFLEKNYSRNFSYDDLVRKFNINKLKLYKAFKVVTKDNVHEFVTKLRVEEAKTLLETSSRTIEDIASKVGVDKSNLNIHFKRITGMTPSDWRKNFRSDGSSYCN